MKIALVFTVVILSLIHLNLGQLQRLRHTQASAKNLEIFEDIGKTLLETLIKGEDGERVVLGKRNSLGKAIAEWLIPTANYANASEQCLEDSGIYADSFVSGEGWALKMYDASGKMPDGLMSYNIHVLGHFDQCLKIQHEEIKGKYCTVFFKTRNASEALMERTEGEQQPKSMFGFLRFLTLFGTDLEPVHVNADEDFYKFDLPSIAFCLPSSCTADDIGSAIADKISRHPLGEKQIVVSTSKNYCYTSDFKEKDFDAAAITVLVLLSIIAFLLVLGTAYDSCKRLYVDDNLGKTDHIATGCEVLLSFSVLRNGEKILDVRQGADSLPCLHGIRFLSMTWVVLGHVWMSRSLNLDANPIQALLDSKTWAMQAISNATPSVDTFFFLSGLLVAYVMLKELNKRKGGFNPLIMYLHRYLRLTPVYAIILGFLATLVIYVGTGPYWQTVRLYFDTGCRINWWHHLLYINNFFSSDTTCMGETWYLANDMQMFLVAPFFVYAIWKWPRKGLIVLAGATVGFIGVPMVIIGIENLPPTLLATRTDTSPNFMPDYYFKPYTRIPPYLVGIFFGYVLHETKGKKVKLDYLTVTWGWLLAIVGGVSIIYGMHDYLYASKCPEIPLAVSIIYGSIHRAVFVACVGWVVFACMHGYGGFVNTLLSWKGFVPLSRLTYCTYLIHLNWLYVYDARLRSETYYTPLDHTVGFVGHLAFSMGLAFIVSVCIEAPFLNIEKLLFTFKTTT